MNNKKAAVTVILFTAVLFVIIGLIAISEHIPILSKPLTFIFAVILVVFVLVFFAISAKRRK